MKKKSVQRSRKKPYVVVAFGLISLLTISYIVVLTNHKDKNINTLSETKSSKSRDVGPISSWKAAYFGSDQVIYVPPEWQTLACSNRGGIGISPVGYSLGDCSGPNEGKIDILTGPAGVASQHPKSGFEKYYSDTEVEVAGIKGRKYVIVSDSDQDSYSEITSIFYVFTTKNKDHIVNYSFTDKESDYSDVLDQIIHTWQF